MGRSNTEKNIKPAIVKHQSLGIKLTQDRLTNFNETRQINADFKVIDLFDDMGQTAGTKVELSLPLVR